MMEQRVIGSDGQFHVEDEAVDISVYGWEDWPSLPITRCSIIFYFFFFGKNLMIVPRHVGAAFTHQEVEVGPLVGLLHVVEVEPPVAALERRFRFLPGFSSSG